MRNDLTENSQFAMMNKDGALDTESTIYEELLSVKQNLIDLEHRIRQCEAAMQSAEGKDLDSLMKQYDQLTHSFERDGGYAYKSEITGFPQWLLFHCPLYES